MTIRDYIDTVKALNEDEPFGWNKAPQGLKVRDQKQIILDALDRLLNIQDPLGKREKVTALREIAMTAKRMADNIEGWERDKARQESGI